MKRKSGGGGGARIGNTEPLPRQHPTQTQVQPELVRGSDIRNTIWSLSGGDGLPMRHALLEGPPAPVPRRGGEDEREEAPGTEPQLLLRGREVPRTLQNQHHVRPRADGGAVCGLLRRPHAS